MRSLALVAIPFLAMVLAACSGNGPVPAAQPSPFTAVGEDPAIVVHDLPEAPDMEVGGRLGYVAEGRCLTVTGMRDGRSVTFSPVWPAGTQPLVRDGRRGVNVPGLGPLLDGDTVSAAGDEWPGDDQRLKNHPPCGGAERFMVFNAGSFKAG
ncbi:hypothetical protein ACFWYW_22885 [Nonomuraea sp. NPDC059023]|uniref:hypothetical protein n=1 Tax=unclassified Nonomuraea TaxID=2593643 RepID=UPI0036B7107E